MKGSRDPARVAAALARFERPLLAYATRITRDPERARDVVQDAFLQLCRADWQEVEPHLTEWLYTVCRNRALDVRRKESRMTPWGDAAASGLDDATAGLGPAEALLHKDAAARAMAMLGRLPANQQEVIRLKFQHGLSYKEISRVTELSVSNVGFLIHTGIKALRERLGAAEEMGLRIED